VGVPTYPLGFVMGGILLAGGAYWLAVLRPSQRRAEAAAAAAAPAPAAPAAADVAEGVPERAETPLDDVPVR
jgi:NAD(P)-dependent dehydrogenase (short-subunit alcohol dehydrogenase family)